MYVYGSFVATVWILYYTSWRLLAVYASKNSHDYKQWLTRALILKYRMATNFYSRKFCIFHSYMIIIQKLCLQKFLLIMLFLNIGNRYCIYKFPTRSVSLFKYFKSSSLFYNDCHSLHLILQHVTVAMVRIMGYDFSEH